MTHRCAGQVRDARMQDLTPRPKCASARPDPKEPRAGSRFPMAMTLSTIVLLAGSLGIAGSGPYTFFLDGRPFDPDAITIAGEPGRLAPGDAISVDGLYLTLGQPGEYRCRSALEGVRLEEGDGRLRWVAVRVGPHYGDGPDFVDGLAGLSRDEVRGLWGLDAEKWTKSCVEKAPWQDVS